MTSSTRPPVPAVLAPFVRQATVLLHTRKRNGTWVPTPVSIAVDGDHAYVRTYTKAGKSKRLRNFPDVWFSRSTWRGRPTGPPVSAHARLLHGDDARHAARLLARKHPLLHGIAVPLAHRLMRTTTLHYELGDCRPDPHDPSARPGGVDTGDVWALPTPGGPGDPPTGGADGVDPITPIRPPTGRQPGGRIMHPFAAALEARDIDAAVALLCDDVVLHSPVVFTPYRGRDTVAAILHAVSRVFEDFHYVRELAAADVRDHAYVFRARVGEREIEGSDFLHLNQHGSIDELTVMLRPLTAAHAFADAMKAQFAAPESATT